MSRQFVIGIDDVSDDQKDALREMFSNHGSWWNWIPGFWLVTTDDNTKASTVRDRVLEIVPNCNCIVIEIRESTWSGYGPSSDNKSMFKWLKNKWKTAKQSD
jgi:hypothetical protein